MTPSKCRRCHTSSTRPGQLRCPVDRALVPGSDQHRRDRPDGPHGDRWPWSDNQHRVVLCSPHCPPLSCSQPRRCSRTPRYAIPQGSTNRVSALLHLLGCQERDSHRRGARIRFWSTLATSFASSTTAISLGGSSPVPMSWSTVALSRHTFATCSSARHVPFVFDPQPKLPCSRGQTFSSSWSLDLRPGRSPASARHRESATRAAVSVGTDAAPIRQPGPSSSGSRHNFTVVTARCCENSPLSSVAACIRRRLAARSPCRRHRGVRGARQPAGWSGICLKPTDKALMRVDGPCDGIPEGAMTTAFVKSACIRGHCRPDCRWRIGIASRASSKSVGRVAL